MIRINLGCEAEYKEGWINIDFDKRSKADLYLDLNKFPYPFKDNSVDEILASAILEHLEDYYKSMMELWRISKDGALIYISVPHFSNFLFSAEAEHKRAFSYFSFGTPYSNKELYPYFEVIKKKITFTRINYPILNKFMNPLINASPTFYEKCLSGIIRGSEVIVILKVKKDKDYIESKKRYMEEKENKIYKKFDNLKFIKNT